LKRESTDVGHVTIYWQFIVNSINNSLIFLAQTYQF